MLDFVFRYVKCTVYVIQKLCTKDIQTFCKNIYNRLNNQLQVTEEDLYGQDMSGRWYVFMDNHFTEFLAIGFQVQIDISFGYFS